MWVQLPPLQPFMLRVAQMVRAPGCGPGGRRFETGHAPHGFLAQLGITALRCRGRKSKAMIPAAVEKCEDQRKPEAFFGYCKVEERQTEDLRVPGPIPGEPTIWENA